MSRIDWLVVRRLASSIALTLAIMYALVCLVESLSTSRFAALSRLGGPQLAIFAILVAAARWLLETLPLTLLVGAVAGLINLQRTRELTVIKAAGISVWRLMAAPLLVTALLGVVVGAGLNTLVVQLDRTLTVGENEPGVVAGAFWMAERDAVEPFIIEAGYVHPSGQTLEAVNVFLLAPPRARIEAQTAELIGGEWVLSGATRYLSNEVPEPLESFRLSTETSAADMRARLSSTDDMSLFELMQAVDDGLNNPGQRAEIGTRLLELLALPVTLCGSLVIAFAFTGGYRRTDRYGGTVLYGIVLGFVVYVVTEMASRAGAAGALQPAVAVLGPALVAIVAGATVLLNREDGRT